MHPLFCTLHRQSLNKTRIYIQKPRHGLRWFCEFCNESEDLYSLLHECWMIEPLYVFVHFRCPCLSVASNIDECVCGLRMPGTISLPTALLMGRRSPCTASEFDFREPVNIFAVEKHAVGTFRLSTACLLPHAIQGLGLCEDFARLCWIHVKLVGSLHLLETICFRAFPCNDRLVLDVVRLR